MATIGKEHGHASVDDEQVDAEGRKLFGITCALRTKRVVRFPIGRHLRVQALCQTCHIVALDELRESSLLVIIEIGQLGNADVRKVLGTQSQESPAIVVHWLQRELMGQILVFVAQLGKIAFVQRILLVTFRNGIHFQQSCLPHEDGLNLEEVVAMFSYCIQGDMTCPLLESVTINAKTVVTGQRHEVGIFP